jgi:hypothetical protein
MRWLERYLSEGTPRLQHFAESQRACEARTARCFPSGRHFVRAEDVTAFRQPLGPLWGSKPPLARGRTSERAGVGSPPTGPDPNPRRSMGTKPLPAVCRWSGGKETA